MIWGNFGCYFWQINWPLRIFLCQLDEVCCTTLFYSSHSWTWASLFRISQHLPFIIFTSSIPYLYISFSPTFLQPLSIQTSCSHVPIHFYSPHTLRVHPDILFLYFDSFPVSLSLLLCEQLLYSRKLVLSWPLLSHFNLIPWHKASSHSTVALPCKKRGILVL